MRHEKKMEGCPLKQLEDRRGLPSLRENMDYGYWWLVCCFYIVITEIFFLLMHH